MQAVHLTFLAEAQALVLWYKLLQEETPVRRGLQAQYFLVNQLCQDWTAPVVHGRKGAPDVILSPSALEKLVASLVPRPAEEVSPALEVKTFAWNGHSFANAWHAYRRRGQTRYPFLGLIPVMLFSKDRTTRFKNFEDGVLSGVVILIMPTAAKESATTLWKAIQEEATRQVPNEMDIVEIAPERLLEHLNFKHLQLQGKELQQVKVTLEQQQAMLEQQQATLAQVQSVLQQQGQELGEIKELLLQLLKTETSKKEIP